MDDLDLDFNHNENKILADYHNVRNIILTYFQQTINIAIITINSKNNDEYKANLRTFRQDYMKFYFQIRDESKLSHIDKEDVKFLEDILIKKNIKVSELLKVIKLLRKLVGKMGIFEIEKGDNYKYI